MNPTFTLQYETGSDVLSAFLTTFPMIHESNIISDMGCRSHGPLVSATGLMDYRPTGMSRGAECVLPGSYYLDG